MVARFLSLCSVVTAALLLSAGAFARSASDFFIDAPADIVPLLPRNSRLDMVDYFNFGSSHTTPNTAGGNAIIKSISPKVLEWEPDKDVNVAIVVLAAPSDSLIAVVTTLRSPMADSSIEFYHTDWQPAPAPVALPDFADWLTPEGAAHADELALKMPFIPVSAAFNDDATVLTLTNEAPYYMVESEYEEVKPWLIGHRVYDIDSLSFTLRD